MSKTSFLEKRFKKKTGTEKTHYVKNTTEQIEEIAKKKEIPIKILYVNCKLKKIADTEYRIIAHLIREFGREIASTGLPTDEVYKSFFNILDSREQLVILILKKLL